MTHMTATKNELKAARAELLADSDTMIADMKKELFAMTAGKRVTEFATPSATFADDMKFKELLSFSPPGGPPTFETSVPPTVREKWNQYLETFQSVHPLNDTDKKKAIDSAEFWKQQLADWFSKEKDGWKKVKNVYDAAVKSEKKDEVEKAKIALLTELDKQFATLKTTTNNMLSAETLSGVVTVAKQKPIEQVDHFTRYFITIVGACIFFGVLTRLNCLLAVGFLVMTYLTHPPFPWLPLPPNTEGNPLFINKNIIEALSLMVIAVHPTGRWLGLDALIHRVLFGRKAFVSD